MMTSILAPKSKHLDKTFLVTSSVVHKNIVSWIDFIKQAIMALQYFALANPTIKAQIIAKQMVDGWLKYQLAVMIIYKRHPYIRLRRGEEPLWISEKHYFCKCPTVRLGRKYLIMGTGDTSDIERSGIVLNSRTIVVEWRSKFDEQLRRFAREEADGAFCLRLDNSRSNSISEVERRR
ncbi:unnamed protein product [Soboliphyme baturini]|uniref:NTR domain-containing protein n=1 Tax=Soboliphyme baturini TaxID=241478 RepID=A0A183ICY6_9BILA|nr:unnamed protein product [Soboliphyme baturini]